MFSKHRDMAAAKAFFESAKMVTDITPDRVTTDGHDSYPRAAYLQNAQRQTILHRDHARPVFPCGSNARAVRPSAFAAA
jgi:putative transposase